MTFGGKGIWETIGQLGAAEVEAFLGSSLDAGVNFIDTADVYSGGQSEELVGGALKKLGRPRDQVVVATKVRGRMGKGPNQVGLSRGHIMDAIDASLRRLQLDYVDLYQIHGFDSATPLEETVRALDDLVRVGKVRYVGYCNLSAWQTMKALAYAREHGLSAFVSAQMYYSLAGRDIEREVVPMLQDQGLALLPWSPLAGGLLSGKFDIDKPGPEGSRRTTFDFPPVDRPRAAAVLTVLRKVAAEASAPVARVALAWMLAKPFVTSIIIGAKTREQLAQNLAATDLQLSKEHLAALDAASALPAEYPGWMLEFQDRDRRPA
jgi:aryl-alcohol dehydrogenase-like predicted oxidoreductase